METLLLIVVILLGASMIFIVGWYIGRLNLLDRLLKGKNISPTTYLKVRNDELL